MPECYRLVIFIPKKVGMPERLPVMGMLEENKVFISSRPGCILYRFYEMESWAYFSSISFAHAVFAVFLQPLSLVIVSYLLSIYLYLFHGGV
jgi:hypothetical protein